jgi:hypothetical protein
MARDPREDPYWPYDFKQYIGRRPDSTLFDMGNTVMMNRGLKEDKEIV